MEVTKSNFETLLPEIKKSIDDSDFIAIDGEFTGLHNGPNVTAYDLPEDYYNKLRIGQMDYLLIQVGLCMFKFDKTLKRYTHRAYNFYIFPPNIKYGGNANFLCEASSLDFLSSQGFDFNKLIREGIPYLSNVDEQDIRDELVFKLNSALDDTTNIIPIPNNLLETVEDACEKIENYLQSDSTDEMVFDDKYNGFVKKLIYQTAYSRFANSQFLLETKTVDGKPYCFVITKGKSKKNLREERFLEENDEISKAVGFSFVAKHLSESKKLIIGHNMLLDICHIVNRFFIPLPSDYSDFKQLVSVLFPRMIDTKYMCNAYPFRDLIISNVLHHLLTRLHEFPFQFIDVDEEFEGYGYSTKNEKSHEAGYDAYVTGLAFISMTTYLGQKAKPEIDPVLPDSSLLEPYMNKLALMKLIDHAYINFQSPDVIPSNRNHVFHITFPKHWVTSDIMQLFSKYCRVHISYCNSTSAWITLLDEEKSSIVIHDVINKKIRKQNILSNDKNEFTIITWEQHLELVKKDKEKSIKPEQHSQHRIQMEILLNNVDKVHDGISESGVKRTCFPESPALTKKIKTVPDRIMTKTYDCESILMDITIDDNRSVSDALNWVYQDLLLKIDWKRICLLAQILNPFKKNLHCKNMKSTVDKICVDASDRSDNHCAESSAVVITKEARDFLLQDLIKEDCLKKICTKTPKLGDLKETCLKNLETPASESTVHKVFEEPNWD